MSIAKKLYLETIVIFKPLKGEVETVVDQAIKNVIANNVWFTLDIKSPIIAMVIIGWIPTIDRTINIANKIEAIIQSKVSKGKDTSYPTRIVLIEIPNIPATKNSDISNLIFGNSSIRCIFNWLYDFVKPFFIGKTKRVKRSENKAINTITFTCGK